MGKRRKNGKRRRSRQTRRAQAAETLEQRSLLSAVMVGTADDVVNAPDTSSIAALLNDPGDDGISLREAILAANADPSPDLVSIEFASGANEAFENGGTIVLTNGQLSVSAEVSINGDVDGDNTPDITISGNNTSRLFQIRDASPHTTLNGLRLTGGNDGFEAGAVRIYRSAATISNSIIEGNRAARFAGGVLAVRSELDIISSTIRDNYSGENGGGLELFRGQASIVSSTIEGNTAGELGGGILSGTGNALTISNSTIVGNSVIDGFGGGLANTGSSATLTHVTITGNSATLGGGGLSAGATETLVNSVVAGNSSTAGAADILGTIDTVTDSIVTGAAADLFDQIDADTGGGLLADNGGTVQTVLLKADVTNPALDRGDVVTGLLVDARGNPREIDLLDLTNGGTVDAGAVELAGDTNALVVDAFHNNVDPWDGVTSLREAILYANSPTAGPLGDGDADGDGSPNDTITFASGSGDAFENGGSITHSGGRLVLSSDITINGDVDGDGDHDIRITGAGRGTRLLHISAGHAQLHGVQLDNGRARYFQGGDEVGAIQLDAGAELTLTSSLISRAYSPTNAAALRNAGTATIIDTEFTGGQGYINSGGINNTAGIHNMASASLTMIDSTFRNNLTNIFYTGGTGLLLNDGTASLTNVTFQKNRGFKGGALQNRSGGVATLTNVTITGNESTGANYAAFQPAGGITNEAGATLTLTNSIDLGNQGREDKDVLNLGTLNLLGGNIIGDEFSVDGVVQTTGITPEDVFAGTTMIQGAEAGEVADNGGPVQTVALKSGLLNPALDAGDDAAAADADARGELRADHAQITNRDGNISDVGAYELPAGSLMISSFGGVARAAVDVVEGTTAVTDIAIVDDVDIEGAGVTYAISDGADQALFDMDATTGALSFAAAPDFEVPLDANRDNVYVVEVEATDSAGHTATQILEVTVTDLAETFVVDNASDEDDGDYSAGELTLREAVGLANFGAESADTIAFADGSGEAFENEATIRLVGGQIEITAPVDIQGDGKVLITADANADDIVLTNGQTDVDATLASDAALSDGIDNDGDGLIDAADTDGETLLDDNSRIFDITNFDAITYLSGLTLTGGSTNAWNEDGGAIRHESPLYIYDSIINGNSTRGGGSEGGGIANVYVDLYGPFGRLKMVGSTVDNNRALLRNSGGGGISSFAGAIYIKDSSVSGNVSTLYGGGINAFYGPTTIIKNSKVNNNTAYNERAKGGGLWSVNAEITDSEFIGNRTTGDRGDGGGIVAMNSLTVDNTIISDNHTSGVRSDGGGIYMMYADDGLRITNSTITNNTTAGVQSSGGGVYVERGNATITNSIISGNKTTGQWSGGGGIHVSRGRIILENSTVTNNATEGPESRGGGVRSDSLTVRNSDISDNRTLGEGSEGGGIAAVRGFGMFDSTVRNNHTYGTDAFGGGIAVFGNLNLTNSEVSGNSTAGFDARGGGAFVFGAWNSTNSTVANNQTSGNDAEGGGVWARTTSTVTNTTLTGNSTDGSSAEGGGLYLSGTPWDEHFVNLRNSILTGNITSHAAVDSNDYDPGEWGNDLNLTAGNVVGAEFTVDGTLVQANLSAEQVFAAVVDNHGVQAGELADNGGSFFTIALRSSLLNPALDSGDDALAPDSDLRGVARADHAQVTNRDGNISDLGSYELPSGAVMFSSFAGAARVALSVDEGTTTVTDLSVVDDLNSEGAGITYSISGGADASQFTVNAVTGELTFAIVPDFEIPADADGDNVYVVEVQAEDAAAFQTTQIIEVTVADLVETYIVDNIGDTDDGDYSAGQLTLREAILLANAGTASADIITFAAGSGNAFENGATIRLTGRELEITAPISIQGDGNVTITADADANDVVIAGGITDVDASLASTAADSDGIDNDNDGLIDAADTDGEDLLDDNSRIFHISSASATTSLSGLVLTGGRTTGNGDAAWGGAILHQAPLFLSDSTVNGNSTSGNFARGGALAGAYYSYAPLSVINSTLDNNRASSAGGAIMNFAADVYIKDSSISGNMAHGQGGGINAYFGQSTIIRNARINNNLTTADRGAGGGLWAEFADIADSEFIGNRTQGQEADGGGLSVGRGLTLTNTTVDDNHTTGRLAKGGGIHMGQMIGGATVQDSVITNNSTAGDLADGGGISIQERDTLISNTQISGNRTTGTGSSGGGIQHDGIGVLTVQDSTLVGNRTEGDNSRGGAIDVNLFSFQNITVSNNQTWGLQSSGGGLNVGTGTISASHISNNQTRGDQALGGGVEAFRLNLIGSVVSGNSTLGVDAWVAASSPPERPSTTVRLSITARPALMPSVAARSFALRHRSPIPR